MSEVFKNIRIGNRKLNRLRDYEYTQDGWYFVTICVKDMVPVFGEIKNDEMVLNEWGTWVEKCWLAIPEHFSYIRLDDFVVMPNHVHGIVVIGTVGNDGVGNKNVGNKKFCSLPQIQKTIPWQTKWAHSLSSVVRGFKIGVTKQFHENDRYDFKWQKSFYDHIIRDEKSLNNIRRYIQNNPLNWGSDRNKQNEFI